MVMDGSTLDPIDSGNIADYGPVMDPSTMPSATLNYPNPPKNKKSKRLRT